MSESDNEKKRKKKEAAAANGKQVQYNGRIIVGRLVETEGSIVES